ncbi:MAG: DUF2238 domain-containing protein [Alphaproteobacteria bacterium]|nr:DUF2238 domain-containing protein [Alphaproteobacteria bacterium]
MGAATDESAPAPFPDNRTLQILAGAFAAVWLLTAIAPHDRFDWLLENMLVIAVVAALGAAYRHFRFSNLSYGLIAVFLILHAVGAHYTYSEVPLGHWIRDTLGQERNHYDRVVHFAFGLLIACPQRELLIRRRIVRGDRAGAIALALVIAWSALYELLEWMVASVVSPGSAMAFLGTQGDPFDAQKDTALATLGAAIAIAARRMTARTS